MNHLIGILRALSSFLIGGAIYAGFLMLFGNPVLAVSAGAIAFCAYLLFICFWFEGRKSQNTAIALSIVILEFVLVFVPLRDSGGAPVFLSPIIVAPVTFLLVSPIRKLIDGGGIN